MEDKKIPQTAELICNIAEQINSFNSVNHEQLLQLNDNELVAAHNLLCYIKAWADVMLNKTEADCQSAAERMNKYIPSKSSFAIKKGGPLFKQLYVIAQPNALEEQITTLRHAPYMVQLSSMEDTEGKTEE